MANTTACTPTLSCGAGYHCAYDNSGARCTSDAAWPSLLVFGAVATGIAATAIVCGALKRCAEKRERRAAEAFGVAPDPTRRRAWIWLPPLAQPKPAQPPSPGVGVTVV